MDRGVPSTGSLRPTEWLPTTHVDHYADPASRTGDTSGTPCGSRPDGTVRPEAMAALTSTSGCIATVKQTFEFSPLAGPNAATIGHIRTHEPRLYKPYVTTNAEELAAPEIKVAKLEELTMRHGTMDASTKPWRKPVMPNYETRVIAH